MKAVCNTSPVITLAKAELFNLLPSLFDSVVIPQAVVHEVKAGGTDSPDSIAIMENSWLEHVTLDPPVSGLNVINLGAGESETIEWASRHPGYIAILDDRAARRTAEALQVRCAGTLRVLYEANCQGLIISFPEAVKSLQNAGLYCDQRTLQRFSGNQQSDLDPLS